MANMRDVAQLAGVSIATVSAVINGTAHVSDELRQRVNAAIDKAGYAPDNVARSLRTGTSRTLGLVVPDITNPLFAALARAVEAAALEAGYAVFLCNTDERTDRQGQYLRLLRAHRAAGVILVPASGTPGEPTGVLDGLSAPTVIVDRAVEGLAADTVTVDNAKGAEDAVAHLIRLGHRRIAAVMGRSRNSPTQMRLNGFRAALRAAGIALDSEGVALDCRTSDEAFRAASAMLARRNPPTAFFASNDKMGLGVLHAISDRGLRCPEQVSFCCFDGLVWAEAVQPPVTTIQQPVEQVGATAVRMVLERIAGNGGPPRSIVLPTAFVIRESCAPPCA